MSDEQVPLLSKVNVQSPHSCSCLLCEPSSCSPAVLLGERETQPPFWTGLSVIVHLVLTVYPLGSGNHPLKEKKKHLYIISNRIIYPCSVCYLSLSEESAAVLPLPWPGLPWGAWMWYTPSPARIFPCYCSLLLSPGDHWLPGDHTADIQAGYSSLLTILHSKIDQRLHFLPVRNLGSHCFPVVLWDWCHPTLPLYKASPSENPMLCTLSRSSRFYLLV